VQRVGHPEPVVMGDPHLAAAQLSSLYGSQSRHWLLCAATTQLTASPESIPILSCCAVCHAVLCCCAQVADHILGNPADKTKVSLVFANVSEGDILLKVRGTCSPQAASTAGTLPRPLVRHSQC
jgi:hypothetical protein